MRWYTCLKMVTHPSTNWAQCKSNFIHATNDALAMPNQRCCVCFAVLCSVRSGERRSDGGAVSSLKQTSRPSDRVRRDRFSPPTSHHISTGSSQAEWKPPPTGDRSRSGQTKGNFFHSTTGPYSLFAVWAYLLCFPLCLQSYTVHLL